MNTNEQNRSADTAHSADSLTFVVIEDANGAAQETALYQSDASGGWRLVTVEQGEPHGSLATVRALGQAHRVVRTIAHLRQGGTWLQSVPDFLMTPSTPTQRIETEIADLRAEAHRRNESDRYSGSWGGGGSLLEAEADAMQHVLDVLTGAPAVSEATD